MKWISIKKEIEKTLRRLGLAKLLIWLVPFSNPGLFLDRARLKDFFLFRRKYGPLFAGAPKGLQPDKKLLVVNLHSITTGVKLEAMLAKGLQLNGFAPTFLTYRSAFWPVHYYRTFGFDEVVFFDDYLYQASNNPPTQDIRQTVDSLRTIDEVLNFEYQGVRIGKYALSTFAREHRLASIDPNSQDHGPLLRKYLYQAMNNVQAAIALIDATKPSTVLLLEKVYMPYGEIFNVALDRGLDVIQWSGCHRESALMLKRYTPETRDLDRSSISDQSWELMKKTTFTAEHKMALKNELKETYRSGQWFSEAGTQSRQKSWPKRRFRPD